MSDDLFVGLLEVEAKRRHDLHADHASNRPLSDDYELIGLIGEAEFSRTFGLPMDMRRRPGGDGGIDFTVPLAFTVDVKTARNAINLIQEKGKVVADIYALAEYSGGDRGALLLGWEYGSILAKAPYKDFGYGIINHYIHRSELRSMTDLGRRIMRLVVP